MSNGNGTAVSKFTKGFFVGAGVIGALVVFGFVARLIRI